VPERGRASFRHGPIRDGRGNPGAANNRSGDRATIEEGSGSWDCVLRRHSDLAIAVVPMFGKLRCSPGHAVLTLLGDVAMTATAVSFAAWRPCTLCGFGLHLVTRDSVLVWFRGGLGDVPGVSVSAVAKQPLRGPNHPAAGSACALRPAVCTAVGS